MNSRLRRCRYLQLSIPQTITRERICLSLKEKQSFFVMYIGRIMVVRAQTDRVQIELEERDVYRSRPSLHFLSRVFNRAREACIEDLVKHFFRLWLW